MKKCFIFNVSLLQVIYNIYICVYISCHEWKQGATAASWCCAERLAWGLIRLSENTLKCMTCLVMIIKMHEWMDVCGVASSTLNVSVTFRGLIWIHCIVFAENCNEWSTLTSSLGRRPPERLSYKTPCWLKHTCTRGETEVTAPNLQAALLKCTQAKSSPHTFTAIVRDSPNTHMSSVCVYAEFHASKDNWPQQPRWFINRIGQEGRNLPC